MSVFMYFDQSNKEILYESLQSISITRPCIFTRNDSRLTKIKNPGLYFCLEISIHRIAFKSYAILLDQH